MSKTRQQRVTIARSLAVEVLRRVEAEGAYSSLVLSHALRKAKNLSAPDRRLVTELLYGTLRWRMKLDYALAKCSHRSLDKIEPVLLRVLRMSTYQLLFLERVPDWAVVDQGTELARIMRGRAVAGFVNGVLRKVAAGKEHIPWPDSQKNPILGLAVQHSFPVWIVEMLLYRFGKIKTDLLMQAFNRPPPLWIRANSLKGTSTQLSDMLRSSGHLITQSKALPNALLLETGEEIGQMESHQTGQFHVQDAAAQAVCALLDPQAGQHVLDACGAPGGKAATLAQLMSDRGEILSVDIHPARVGLVRKLTHRLGLGCVRAVAYDLAQPLPVDWGLFDAVILDAPCSSLGTLRRHPERKWRSSPSDLEPLVRVQKSLLDSIARAVKPGGVLVYSICTLTEQEGPMLLDSWLSEHPEFSRHDPRSSSTRSWHSLLDERGALATWPDRDNMDAFYAVRLIKQK